MANNHEINVNTFQEFKLLSIDRNIVSISNYS